jgi:hypothetical protein
MTRPVKRQLAGYEVIEANLQAVIFAAFDLADLSADEQDQVRSVDDALLYYEFEALMSFPIFATVPAIAMDHDFAQRDFGSVESEFLGLYDRLANIVKK